MASPAIVPSEKSNLRSKKSLFTFYFLLLTSYFSSAAVFFPHAPIDHLDIGRRRDHCGARHGSGGG
jgi:hypothetical protein